MFSNIDMSQDLSKNYEMIINKTFYLKININNNKDSPKVLIYMKNKILFKLTKLLFTQTMQVFVK